MTSRFSWRFVGALTAVCVSFAGLLLPANPASAAASARLSRAYAAPGDSVTVYGYGFYPGGDVVVGIDLRRTSPGLQIRPMPTPAAVGTVSLPGAPAQATNTPAPAGAQHGFGYRYISVWYHTVHASRHSVAHFTLAR